MLRGGVAKMGMDVPTVSMNPSDEIFGFLTVANFVSKRFL